jgi:hypothetical protein
MTKEELCRCAETIDFTGFLAVLFFLFWDRCRINEKEKRKRKNYFLCFSKMKKPPEKFPGG